MGFEFLTETSPCVALRRGCREKLQQVEKKSSQNMSLKVAFPNHSQDKLLHTAHSCCCPLVLIKLKKRTEEDFCVPA